MASPASQMPLLYDRDCGFCRVSVALVLTWDRRRRVRPVAIQSEEGQRLLAELPAERRLESAHAVTREGQLASGGLAAVPVLCELPGGGPLARVGERFPGLTDRAYRAIAGRRDRIGPLIPARAKRWADRRISAHA
jgi:predicted DCC family thiol-disulfide oxidoreductase YuxK